MQEKRLIVDNLNCSCRTTTIAKKYLTNEATLRNLRTALDEHWNHACYDFIQICQFYEEEREKEKNDSSCP